MDKIRDQEDLLNIKDGPFKEVATRLKAQQEEGSKVRKLLKDKYQNLQIASTISRFPASPGRELQPP